MSSPILGCLPDCDEIAYASKSLEGSEGGVSQTQIEFAVATIICQICKWCIGLRNDRTSGAAAQVGPILEFCPM